MFETTFDGILGQRLTLEQPRDGFRIAVDTVVLASSVQVQAGQSILDIGCGVGGAMLCVTARVPQVRVTGIDIQPELIELCRRNIERNGFQDRAKCLCIAVAQFDVVGDFDHVVMNPPYHDDARHDVSDNAVKRIANAGDKNDLVLWIKRSSDVLRTEGELTLIHRADRQDDILVEVQKYFNAIQIVPICPKPDAPAKRFVLRAKKGSHAALQMCRRLILHRADGRYTDEAEAILRHAKNLEFRAR